ncbi:MAG: hypothetical protein WD883_01195 [Candidatus Colwellbacteria bacterium]
MEDNKNQPGGASSSGTPGDKINPMSPNFMVGNAPSQPEPPQMPSNPPTGGAMGTNPPPPSPPPPPPPPIPPQPPTAPPASPGGVSPVPPPPPKQVDIRTMASDQESLKSSGGLGTAPQAVKPLPDKHARKVDSAGKPMRGGGKKKALLMGAGIVAFLLAAAAVTNYFVLPIFLSDTQLAEPPAVEEVEDPNTNVTPTIPTFVHTSYFEEPSAGGSVEANVNTVNGANIVATLQQLAANRASQDVGAVTEFYVTAGLTGSPVTGADILAVLLPDVQFTVNLDEDFTGFMYSDGTDVSPGYIFALDGATTDMAELETSFRDTFESSTELDNFFLTNPGAQSDAGFREGAAMDSGGNSRWITFSGDGMSLDYGIKGSFVVISTSFDGFKAALAMLGDSIPGAQVETEAEAETLDDETNTPPEA